MLLVQPPGPWFVRLLIRTLTLLFAAAGLTALVMEVQSHWLAPIPFFNLFVGGPSNGYKYLVDSSLDWGQDLPRFGMFMRTMSPHPTACSQLAGALVRDTRASETAAGRDPPVFYLSYFGWGHPPSHDLGDTLDVVYIHSSVSGTSTRPRHMKTLTVHIAGGDRRKKAYLAVGASIFQGVYNSIATGSWNAWYELQWRRMRRCVKRLHSSGENDFMVVMSTLPQFKEFILNYDGYRLARMYASHQTHFPNSTPHPLQSGALVFAMSRRNSTLETAFLCLSWVRHDCVLCWTDRPRPKLVRDVVAAFFFLFVLLNVAFRHRRHALPKNKCGDAMSGSTLLSSLANTPPCVVV
jgi:hypothetical protein